MRVLVTRPADTAAAVSDLLRAAGHAVLLSPLLVPEPVPWDTPDGRFDGVVATSASALRFAGDKIRALTSLPLWAVGAATAEAARAAGFADVRTGAGGVAELLEAASGRLLHLAGEDRTEVQTSADLVVVEIYRARFTDGLTTDALAALGRGSVDWALLFSSRSAARFAALFDAAGLDRRTLALGALSPAVLAAAGGGWRDGIAAVLPTTTDLLAATGLACEKPAQGAG